MKILKVVLGIYFAITGTFLAIASLVMIYLICRDVLSFISSN